MSGEVKFGRTVDRWIRGDIATVPIVGLNPALEFAPTGERLEAANRIGDIERGQLVELNRVGETWNVVLSSIPFREQS